MVSSSPPERRRVYRLKAREARFTVEERERRLHEKAPLCKCGCGKVVQWDAGRARWRRYASVTCYHPSKPHQNEAWLRERYETRKESVYAMADEAGVTVSAIIKQMKRHGIARRSASESHAGLQRGAENPAWRGGVTPERQRLYRSSEWKALLIEVFTRDGFHCQRCRMPKTQGRVLHAHHIHTWADAPELRMVASNLTTLCGRCHRWVHSRRNTSRAFLA